MYKHGAAFIYVSVIQLLTHFAEDLCHLKCSCGVHVGSDDGDASVGLFGVAECEGPLKVHLRVERNWTFISGTLILLGKCFNCYSCYDFFPL